MPARTLFIGLDAADGHLIEAWAKEGVLPNLGRLMDGGAWVPVSNRVNVLPDALWPEIATGQSVLRTGDYLVHSRLHSGESASRREPKKRAQNRPSFWRAADEQGQQCAVFDFPETAVSDTFSGVHLQEFGMHHRGWGSESAPATLLGEMWTRFGRDEVGDCDFDYAWRISEHVRLIRNLRQGIELKGTVAAHLLEQREWDLFTVVFSQAHCAGHQLWYLHDPRHPQHPRSAPVEARAGMRQIYVELDRQVGRLVELSGPSTRLFVLTSHGMGMRCGGYQFLPQFLDRLGLAGGRRFRVWLGTKLPRTVRSLIASSLSPSFKYRHGLGQNSQFRSFAPRSRALPQYNSFVGSIRLNLIGREPQGTVTPGSEARDLLERIDQELRNLKDPRSGSPVVAEIRRIHDEKGQLNHTDLPDLTVSFRTDLGYLGTCASDTVGRLSMPTMRLTRTGEHRDVSRLLIGGLGATVQQPAPQTIDLMDIAPTLLDLLRVKPLECTDGTSFTSALGIG